MATIMADSIPQAHKMTGEERKVILASSVGTAFEWYDFYIYGTLATISQSSSFPAWNHCNQIPTERQSARCQAGC